MTQKVIDIIAYSSENHSIDFKKLQYPIGKHAKKHELLKDISAMANHPSNEDKYIIVGVKEKNGIANVFHNLTEIVDEAKYQEYLGSNIEPHLNFEYSLLKYQDYQLAYFRIYKNNDRPYLLKREVRNAVNGNKIEYREGDGFIRVGTSTKKITRQIFDDIYDSKQKSIDRKQDLKITPHFGVPNDELLGDLDVHYLDIDIENISTRSIDFDIEMKVYRSSNFSLLSEPDIRKAINENKGSNFYSIGQVSIPSFHVDIEEYEDFIIISRTKLRYEKTAVSIEQKKTEKNIFNQYLFVVEKTPSKIKCEITIRSDDFTEGILSKSFEITDDN